MALTPEQEATALTLASNGWTIKDIRDYLGLTNQALWRHRLANPTFDTEFRRARQSALEELADSLLTVVDEFADVQKARLQSDNIKWTLSKRQPEIYGDKIDINISQQVSITTALTEARARLLPSEQPGSTQLIDITPQSDTSPADSVSAALPETRDADVKKQGDE